MFTYSKEIELHEFIISNFSNYFDFDYNSSEFVVNGGRIDIIGTDDNTIYVIEIKRDIITKQTIKQLSVYLPEIQLLHPDKSVLGIAIAPNVCSNVIDSLPDNIKVQTIDDVGFIKPKVNTTLKTATFTIEEELIKELQEFSKETMIAQSKIVELAIKEQLKKMKSTIQ